MTTKPMIWIERDRNGDRFTLYGVTHPDSGMTNTRLRKEWMHVDTWQEYLSNWIGQLHAEVPIYDDRHKTGEFLCYTVDVFNRGYA